jgi:FKBP-type peptidyl-prolyl cis-trans isomerase SlyD
VLTVQKEHIISLRYTMKDDQGVLLEDRMNGRPVEFLYGMGQILPELEAHLLGLKTGDTTSLSFSTEIGNSVTSFHFEVLVDQVRLATATELENGRPENEDVKDDCGPGCDCFN